MILRLSKKIYRKKIYNPKKSINIDSINLLFVVWLFYFAAEKHWLLSICCHISIVLHYFSIIINFEWFWELSVYWYCKKRMKNKIGHKLTTKKIRWPQIDAATRLAKKIYIKQWKALKKHIKVFFTTRMNTDHTKIYFTSQKCIEFILFPINHLWISYMVTNWCVYLAYFIYFIYFIYWQLKKMKIN